MNAIEFKSRILTCYDSAYAIAYSIVRDSDDARDITQEVFKHLWEIHSKLDIPESPRAFCAIAARNAALSRLRSYKHEETIAIDSTVADIPDETEIDPRQNLLSRAIAQLDPRRQTLIKLSLDGKPNDEIASELGISEGNLRQLLSRTRHQLRDIISSMMTK